MALNSGTGLDFKRTFAAPTAAKDSAKADRPKAQFWLNIGYAVQVPVEGGGMEQRFISLPSGIPLDTMEELKTNSSNAMFAAMQAARNDLFKQLMAAAEKLEPGEDKIFGEEGTLQIQLRHVREENAEISPEDNVFTRPLSL